MNRSVVGIRHPDRSDGAATAKEANLSRTLRMMERYGLVALKKNVREIEPKALATSFKILIDRSPGGLEDYCHTARRKPTRLLGTPEWGQRHQPEHRLRRRR